MLMIVGGVTLVLLAAMAAEHWPTLSQLNLAALQGQSAPPENVQADSNAANSNPSTPTENPDDNSEPSIDDDSSLDSAPQVTQPARPDPPRTRRPNREMNPPSSREAAPEEYDTDRGRALLAKVQRIVIVRDGTPGRNQDPRGAIWKETVANCRNVIEKLGLEATTNGGGREASVMKIKLDVRPSSKGTPGTKEISISAVLTCAESPEANRPMQFAKVWRGEQDLGTISAKSSKAGKLPNSVESQLANFFGKFRNDYQQAVQAAKVTAETE